MVTIKTRYDGGLRCSAQHGPSDSQISTDAPKDNQGLGESFSPTDLVATALATCALTTCGIVARREGLVIDGAVAVIEKIMTTVPRRRIGALPMRITFPAGIPLERRALLEETARTCPVAISLDDSIDLSIEFGYADD